MNDASVVRPFVCGSTLSPRQFKHWTYGWIALHLLGSAGASNEVFTRSSKRPAIHVHFESFCWKFAGRLLDRVNTL